MEKKRQQKSLAQKPRIDKLTLADGKEYTLKPMNVNLYIEVEDKFDQPIGRLLIEGRMKTTLYILYLRLKDNYPELTEDKLGELIDDGVLEKLKEKLGLI